MHLRSPNLIRQHLHAHPTWIAPFLVHPSWIPPFWSQFSLDFCIGGENGPSCRNPSIQHPFWTSCPCLALRRVPHPSPLLCPCHCVFGMHTGLVDSLILPQEVKSRDRDR